QFRAVMKLSALARLVSDVVVATVCRKYRETDSQRLSEGPWVRHASRTGTTVITGVWSVNKIQSRVDLSKLRHGIAVSTPMVSKISRKFLPNQAPGQAAIAPSIILRFGSGTMRSSAGSNCLPTP